jgi:hypothetical protein
MGEMDTSEPSPGPPYPAEALVLIQREQVAEIPFGSPMFLLLASHLNGEHRRDEPSVRLGGLRTDPPPEGFELPTAPRAEVPEVLKTDLGQKRHRQLAPKNPEQQLAGDMNIVHTLPSSRRMHDFKQ